MRRDFDRASAKRGDNVVPLSVGQRLRANAEQALTGNIAEAFTQAGMVAPTPTSAPWATGGTGYDFGLLGGEVPTAPSFGADLLSKAMTTPPEKGEKGAAPPSAVGDKSPEAIYYYFQSLLEQLGWRERYGLLSFDTIDSLWQQIPMCAGIRQTRLNQVSNFCNFTYDKFEPGCRLRMRHGRDEPTRSDRDNMRRMQDMLEQCSAVDVDARLTEGLDTFVRKFLRDSMTYDQASIEMISGRDGRPTRWLVPDAKTIRLANPTKLYPTLDLDEPYAVQVIDQQVVKQFSRRNLAFCVRNPRTDIRSFGYGESEVEMLISALTSLMFSTQHNDAAFKNGANVSGILNVKGVMPDVQLKVFRAQFYQMLSGPRNAHRLPIMNQDGLDWIDFKRSNRDMEYAAWIDFLIKIICAVFCLDPIEVNFKYASSGGKSMFEGASKSKVAESKDRGLRPLLRFMERNINRNIVWPINPAYSFEFTGLDLLTPKELADLMVQRVRSIQTVNEVRGEFDWNKLPYGDVILDANYANFEKAGKAEDAAEEAAKKSEAELEAQAAILASMPESQLADDEIAKLAAHLAGAPDENELSAVGAGPGSLSGPPAAADKHGPGGGRRGTAPALPTDPNAKAKPNPATGKESGPDGAPVAKSASVTASANPVTLLEFEV